MALSSFSFRLKSVAGGAAPAKAPEKTGLLAKVWNEQTQISIYITIWYLGNVYCKSRGVGRVEERGPD
jgi:hypothetical protein